LLIKGKGYLSFLIILFRPSKSDSAPVYGDGYEPGLRSSDPEPTQRRRIACGQDLVVVVGVKGGGKNFSDGEILKNTTVALYIRRLLRYSPI
jgi:hypothetical protein